MDFKNIAILGPGGNVGSAIINELLKDPERNTTITAITRSTSTYAPINSNIVVRPVDYGSLESLKEAFHGQDAVVNCTTGESTQYEPSKLIIDAAVEAGVKFYFANEFVGNISSEQYKRMPEAMRGAKIRIREYLAELVKGGKISWTALNGGPFFDMWLMKGPAGINISKRQARIYGTGNNRLYWTPLPIIAQAAVNMLRNPAAVSNRGIYICPFVDDKLSQTRLLAAVMSVLGAKFSVSHVDVAKINENARIALDRGDVKKAARGLAISNQFCEDDSGSSLEGLTENELVGVQQMGIEEAVRLAIERYGEDCPIVESMYQIDPCEI